MSDIVKFQGAGLPRINIGTFRQQLQQARDTVVLPGSTPFLRLGKDDGVWVYGQEDTEVEEGSLWAINPLSMQVGVIAWPPQSSKLKDPIKKMRAIFDASSPPIDKLQLGQAANGGEWDDCISFQLQCVGGIDEKTGKEMKVEDVGVVIEYQQNSYGGKQAFDEIAKAMMVQVESNPNMIVPVCLLKSSSYTHQKWGVIHKPEFDIVKWVAMDGSTGEEPQQQQEQEQPAAEKPARGRRGAAAAEVPPPGQQPDVPQASVQQPQPGVVRRRRRAA